MRPMTMKTLCIALLFSVMMCGCTAAKKTSPTPAPPCNTTTWDGTYSGITTYGGGMQPLTLTINGGSFTGTLGGSPISGTVSYCAGESYTNPCSPVGVNSIDSDAANPFEITINGVLYQSEFWKIATGADVQSYPNLCVGEMFSFSLLPFAGQGESSGWGLTNAGTQ